ncbi:MAG: hypothetical protein ACI8T1_003184, partial [Verrucomicrobiales bacterium]
DRLRDVSAQPSAPSELKVTIRLKQMTNLERSIREKRFWDRP